MRSKTFLFFLIISNTFCTFSAVTPRSLNSDSRLKVVPYSENEVINLLCHYDVQTMIELAKGEEVKTISMGDTTSWKIDHSDNKIFLKPSEEDSETNMTVVTNKRTYFFELRAKEIDEKNKNEATYRVKFTYNDDRLSENVMNIRNFKSESVSLSESPEDYNLNYYVSGDRDIAPTKIYDDGKFTYIQFSQQHKDIPAIFAVDSDLKEHIVNYTVSEGKPELITIKVEQVFSKLALRLGPRVLCIYNEGYANFAP